MSKIYKKICGMTAACNDSYVWWLSGKQYTMPHKYKSGILIKWKRGDFKNYSVGILCTGDKQEKPLLIAPLFSQVSATNNPFYLVGCAKNKNTYSLSLIDIANLKPIKNIKQHLKRAELRSGFSGAGKSIAARFQIKSGLRPGVYRLKSTPQQFKAVGEYLFFDDTSGAQPHANLYIVDFISEQLFVVSQKWYERYKKYDAGYTYLLQAFRDPQSGDIMGRGIRMGLFVLSSDGKRFKQWINENTFYLIV